MGGDIHVKTAEVKTTLYCTEGNSDKVYVLWIEGVVKCNVQAQYGRRGGPMQAACKAKGVTWDAAMKVYEKTLAEKRAKGYHEGEAAPAFSQVTDAVDSGLRPMLLTDCSEEGPERFIEDDAWIGQEKINGKRIMLVLKEGEKEVFGVNRRGLRCPIPKELMDPKNIMPDWPGAPGEGSFVFDGELVGGKYVIFDVLDMCGVIDKEFDFESRSLHLEDEMRGGDTGPNVTIVEQAFDREEKVALVKKLRKGCKEGVVFKKKDALYEPGRRENVKKAIAVKCKFYAEGTFEVLDWNEKSSIEVSASGMKNSRVSVGNVTVPAKYAKGIKKGDLVRVRYLYATDANQLYQANLDPDSSGSVVRDDVSYPDCVEDLKHEGKEEE